MPRADAFRQCLPPVRPPGYLASVFDATALSAALASLPVVRLAVLFGSMTTGRGRPDSDVDIAVEIDPDVPQARAQVIAVSSSCIAGPVDIVFLNDAGPQLRFEIARAGRVLHERDARAWETMKARAMIDWWDWQPTARIMSQGLLSRLRAARVNADVP